LGGSSQAFHVLDRHLDLFFGGEGGGEPPLPAKAGQSCGLAGFFVAFFRHITIFLGWLVGTGVGLPGFGKWQLERKRHDKSQGARTGEGQVGAESQKARDGGKRRPA